MLGIAPGKVSSEYRLYLVAFAFGVGALLAGTVLAALKYPWPLVASLLATGAALVLGSSISYGAQRSRMKGNVVAARIGVTHRGEI